MPDGVDDGAVLEALRRQGEPDEHDLSLIRERLAWSPDDRVEANARFVRFYLTIRPQGPLLRD
jgi:hypothetical protein